MKELRSLCKDSIAASRTCANNCKLSRWIRSVFWHITSTATLLTTCLYLRRHSHCNGDGGNCRLCLSRNSSHTAENRPVFGDTIRQLRGLLSVINLVFRSRRGFLNSRNGCGFKRTRQFGSASENFDISFNFIENKDILYDVIVWSNTQNYVILKTGNLTVLIDRSRKYSEQTRITWYWARSRRALFPAISMALNSSSKSSESTPNICRR